MSSQRQVPSAGADSESARQDFAKGLVDGLFMEWYGPLVRYAYRATGSFENAEDIVQGSFVELYRALLENKSIENPRGWTLCVVRREIVDRLREKTRHGALLSLSEVENHPGIHSDPSPMSWEGEEDITRYLSVLSAREEEVLLLRAKALKYRQIASELKISVNSVKTLLARAIRKMQQASKAAGTGVRPPARRGDNVPQTLQ